MYYFIQNKDGNFLNKNAFSKLHMHKKGTQRMNKTTVFHIERYKELFKRNKLIAIIQALSGITEKSFGSAIANTV